VVNDGGKSHDLERSLCLVEQGDWTRTTRRYLHDSSKQTNGKKNDLTDGVCKALFVDAILPKAEYEDDDVDGGRDEAVQASGFVRLENGGFAEVHDVKMLDTKKAFFNSELNATTIWTKKRIEPGA